MKETEEDILKQINIDTIFFFLAVISAGISFYLITEKKKSALDIPSIDNDTANEIYYYNRRLKFIIALYFFLNAYYSYQIAEDQDKEQELLLVAATFFNLIGAILYLPLGNSNLIIEN